MVREMASEIRRYNSHPCLDPNSSVHKNPGKDQGFLNHLFHRTDRLQPVQGYTRLVGAGAGPVVHMAVFAFWRFTPPGDSFPTPPGCAVLQDSNGMVVAYNAPHMPVAVVHQYDRVDFVSRFSNSWAGRLKASLNACPAHAEHGKDVRMDVVPLPGDAPPVKERDSGGAVVHQPLASRSERSSVAELTPASPAHGVTQSRTDTICYFVMRGGDGVRGVSGTNEQGDARWRTFLQTWPALAKGRVYSVLSKPKVSGLRASGKDAINGSGSVDHTRRVIALPLRDSYDTLGVKSLAMWRYLSRSFESDGWGSACAWFVKVDEDTWLNAPLFEARLGCASPDRPVYSGYTHVGFGIGGFYFVSRNVVRSIEEWMPTFVPKQHSMKHEDNHFSALCKHIGVPLLMLSPPHNYIMIRSTKNDSVHSWDSYISDERRLCTQAIHPIKSVVQLHAMHQAWGALTRKLPEYYRHTLVGKLCLKPSDTQYALENLQTGAPDLMNEMMACSKA